MLAFTSPDTAQSDCTLATVKIFLLHPHNPGVDACVPPLQPSYTPTAMNYDFALITLKDAASASAGYMGMTVGQGDVTLNLTTAGYPVRFQASLLCSPTSDINALDARLLQLLSLGLPA